MANLTPLEQVQADAARLTLKRIAEEKERKAWQVAQEGTVSLGDDLAAVEAEKSKAVKTKKGK
jgi:hypothetical protein